MPTDPYRNYKWEVEQGGFTRAGFQKVSGLTRTTEEVKYREGGDNETSRKLPGQTGFDDIVLERGKSSDDDFNSWAKQIYDLDKFRGNQPPSTGFRRKLTIYLKDKDGTRVKKWTIVKCWPKEYKIADLDAMGNDVLVESLTLATEGWKEENLAASSPFFD